MQDLQEELIHYLVTASTVGRKQSSIVTRFKGIGVDRILNELKALQAEQRVDKYIVKGKGVGRAAIIWRATNKIYDA